MQQPVHFPQNCQKSLVGYRNYLAGQVAENTVERHYLDQGYSLCARRWRGGGGELDLIFKGNGGLIFVEVKRARTHDQAAARISLRQIHRIFTAATVYMAQADVDPLTDMRFDAAIVDGMGAVQVLENAMMAV